MITAFMNSYSEGKSGGDMVFIETAKRFPIKNIQIVTSTLGKELCQSFGLHGRFFITSRERKFKGIFQIYIQRTISALFLKLNLRSRDVLLGTSDFFPDIFPIFFYKIRNREVKWIQHVFHLIPRSRKISFLSQRVSLFFIKRFADIIIVDNTLLKQDLIQLGFLPSKIVINYPGINLEYLQSVRALEKKYGYDGIFMAQLRPAKGIYDLVKIWKMVCLYLPNAKLGIIGKGQIKAEERLKNEIKKESLEKNIDLLGYISDNRAFSIIKTSRVFVFPSHEEGFGIAPLEAQGLGLPVVAWNLPVFDEVFTDGMIKVPKGDIGLFAREVIKFLTDSKKYRETSSRSVQNAQRFNWDMVAEKEFKYL